VAAEIALGLMLAVGAGLMLQTLWRLHRVDPGFNADRVLALHLLPPNVGSQAGRTTSGFYQLALEKLRALPGVSAAGAIQHLPFSGYSWNGALDIEGHDVPPGASRPVAGLRIVTPGYFKAMGQPVLLGREFDWADSMRETAVIVNRRSPARITASAAAALNRRLRIRGGGIQSQWMTVVGVVGDVRHVSLTAAAMPEIYTPSRRGRFPR